MSDQELEEVTFNVIVSANWWKNPPKFKVWIDDEMVQSGVVEELQEKNEKKIISFSKSLTEGEHSIFIELYGKTFAETITDPTDENKILKDQLLTVEDIEIDEISLGHLVFNNSKFKPNKRFHPTLPDEFTEMTCIGFNGKLELKFQVPTYIWFLENL
jgi:hypothetical protein